MSDASNETVAQTAAQPAATPEAVNAPAPAAPAAAPAEDATPKWDGDFDPERAARLVANLREEVKGYKSELAKAREQLSEYERAQMSEQERIAAEAEDARKQLAETRRELAMLKYGLPEKALKFLHGSTPEEIDAQAKELAETFGVAAQKQKQKPELPPTLPVPGNGDAPAGGKRQITEADLDSMSPYEIVRAREEGLLDHLWGGK